MERDLLLHSLETLQDIGPIERLSEEFFSSRAQRPQNGLRTAVCRGHEQMDLGKLPLEVFCCAKGLFRIPADINHDQHWTGLLARHLRCLSETMHLRVWLEIDFLGQVLA